MLGRYRIVSRVASFLSPETIDPLSVASSIEAFIISEYLSLILLLLL